MTMDDIEIEDLYQELIVDHSRRPRNFRRLENPTHQAEGFNPLCGDKVRVYVDLSNNIVRDVAFEGEGCPVAASLPLEVESKLNATEGVKSAMVELTWDPPWNPEKMSESARLQLGMI